MILGDVNSKFRIFFALVAGHEQELVIGCQIFVERILFELDLTHPPFFCIELKIFCLEIPLPACNVV